MLHAINFVHKVEYKMPISLFVKLERRVSIQPNKAICAQPSALTILGPWQLKGYKAMNS